MTADPRDSRLSQDTDSLIGAFGSSLHEYAVFSLDQNGRVTSWNPGAENLTGLTGDEILGASFTQLYTPEQLAEGHPDWVLDQANEHGTYTEEGWRVRKDGTWFWAHVVLTALRGEDGASRGFAGLTRDDTEAHTRLARSLRQFNDLFGLTPIGIGLFDEDGRVLDANDALCDLLGYQPGDIIGLNAVDMIALEDPRRDELRAMFESGSTAPPSSHEKWLLLRSDQQHISCELHGIQSTLATGEPFWLVVFEDVTEWNDQAEALHRWATHDELTGLPNRMSTRELLTSVEHPERMAAMYCDINNFKRINESLGHAAGDEVLVTVARRLRTGLPPGWLVARVTGDEYLVICPDVGAAGGIEQASAHVSALFRTTLALRGELVQLSASIGVATPEDGVAIDDLVRVASAAALHTKAGSSEQISVAGPALIDSINRQVHLEGMLREALETDGLTLSYQPVVSADGVITTAEALVRWDHPERGLLYPGVFLPAAERGGMMRDLDRWVLGKALHDAAKWPIPPSGDPVTVSVNIAEFGPSDPEFLDFMTGLITETGIEWNRVILELVETAILDLPSGAVETARTLIERGVRFAVDDFGTGYSSLARIKEFPINIIKIDRAFVSQIATDPWEYAVVKAVSDLATAMGCGCTAEGVETHAQFEALRSIPVSSYQGWLFSHAVAPPELASMIEAGPLYPISDV